ncbi:MAG: VanW family protein [Clostridia bacterium]|nr:VanW family protein [Clostridia bacterium]
MPRHPSGKNPVSSQNRASYPPDVQDDAFIPVQQPLYEDEDTQFFEQNAFSAPYPDPVYSEDEQGDPTPVYNPPPRRPAYPANASPRYRNDQRKPAGRRAPWTVIALLGTAVLMLLIYAATVLYQPYRAFTQMVREVTSTTFANGVYVDGVHVGGLTMNQARNLLHQQLTQSGKTLAIDVQVDQFAWRITENDVPFQRNTETVLAQAYAIGRQDSTQTLSGGTTPLEYRYQHRMQAAKNGAYFYTEVTYDKSHVRAFVENVSAYVNRSPVNAMVATFDFSTRAFTFTEDQPGALLDAQALYDRIVALLDNGSHTGMIAMTTQVLTPDVTRVELMNSFARITTFSTQTTQDANRNTNIDLACRAVSGTVLMPGDVFSFNQATGQRTAEKGYLPAAAIAGGTTVDEIAGGVCQVSGTLFNAAAMADMTIIERTPHTWPSNYVEKGQDATVNWPNLDFKFRNDSSGPIFILAHYANRVCTVEIYGVTLGAGVTIQLETEVTSTTPPPTEPAYTQNPLLAPGTANVLKKARTGYTVDTYRVYLHNGQVTRRELLCTSTYRMIQELIEYN